MHQTVVKINLCTGNGNYNDKLKGKYLNRLCQIKRITSGEKPDALKKEIKDYKSLRWICQIKQITPGEKQNALTKEISNDKVIRRICQIKRITSGCKR